MSNGTLRIAALLAFALVSGQFFLIVGDMVVKGIPGFSIGFLLSRPLDAGRQGGVLPILVSTILILLVSLLVALPLGVGAAIVLSEFSGSFGGPLRLGLDSLASIPSIVFGLFGAAFFCEFMGLGYSILAGGLTLAVMVLPIIARTAERGFRAVPVAYREGGEALSLSRVAMLRHLLLPAAAPAILAGALLALARAAAETAALIFTSGYVSRMPGSLLDSGRTLSVHILDLAMNVPGGERNAFASALLLLILLFSLDALVTAAMKRWLPRQLA